MSRIAFACLLAGGCCIAFAPIFVRLSDTGPVASAFWRVALAAPMLWAWVGLMGSESNSQGRDSPRSANSTLTPLILAGLFFALDLGFWHWSIVWTSVANSTLL